MFRVAPLALAVCLVAAVAAASGSGIINYTKLSYSYSPRDIAYAGGSGELWTEIAGNPFFGSQPDFDKAVTDAMYAAHPGPPTKFTTTPGPTARRVFHVRLVFNGPPSNSSLLCVGPPSAVPAPSGGNFTLYAAFCQDAESLTFLQAEGNGFSGPTDPDFRAFIKQVTETLFPAQNPQLFRNGPGDCRKNSC
jgi:hypothetical protein